MSLVTPNGQLADDYPAPWTCAVVIHPCGTPNGSSPQPLRINDFPERFPPLCRGADGSETAASHAGWLLRGMDHVPGLLLRHAPARLSVCALVFTHLHPNSAGDHPNYALEAAAFDS